MYDTIVGLIVNNKDYIMKLMLKPDGILCVFWDSEARKEESRKIEYEDAFPYLLDPVTSAEGATVNNILQIIRADVDLYAKLFKVPYLQELLDETRERTKGELPLEGISISWACETSDYKGESDFGLYPTASGIGPYDGEEYDGGPKVGEEINNYGLDFTPLSEMASLPLSINDDVVMESSRKLSQSERKIRGGKKYDYVQTNLGKHQFTLLNIMDALIEEASFFGAPEDKKAAFDDLKDSVKEADDYIKDGGEGVPLEDVLKKFNIHEDDNSEDGVVFKFDIGSNVKGFDCGGFTRIGIVKNRHYEKTGNVYEVVYYDNVRGKVVEDPFHEGDLKDDR